jgi:hypothetical protein
VIAAFNPSIDSVSFNSSMPSRKKAKGRARRAAKEAKAAAEEEEEADADEEQAALALVANQDGSLEAQMQRLSIGDLLRESDVVQKCRHGFQLESHEERLCFDFVSAFFAGYYACCDAGDKNIGSCFGAGIDATKAEGKFADVWKDVAMMEDVVSYLLASGAQNILDGNDGAFRFEAALACFFEQYVQVELKRTHHQIDGLRIAELHWSDMNTMVNYFRKRIPCQCLDKKYEEVKSVAKMGLCCNPGCSLPDRQVERKKSFCCTGCGDTYCQKAHWPEHKKECSRMAEAVAKLKKG